MHRVAIASICLLLGMSRAFAGQPINLVCSGTFNQWESQHKEGGPFRPASQKSISTPQRSRRRSDNFESRRSMKREFCSMIRTVSLKVDGSLDRMTGHMIIVWFNAGEEAKMRAGLSAKASMSSEMQCNPAKPLYPMRSHHRGPLKP
jgi:hypothetical protein